MTASEIVRMNASSATPDRMRTLAHGIELRQYRATLHLDSRVHRNERIST
jgi:hypothetical protein